MAWGLRAPYRQGAKWLMNSNTANAVDKLKDGDGRYLWREGMLAGVPPSLLGYTVEFSEDMPDVASGRCWEGPRASPSAKVRAPRAQADQSKELHPAACDFRIWHEAADPECPLSGR
jgi:hypothetical protein